jgi:hypothetical protein
VLKATVQGPWIGPSVRLSDGHYLAPRTNDVGGQPGPIFHPRTGVPQRHQRLRGRVPPRVDAATKAGLLDLLGTPSTRAGRWERHARSWS